MQELVRLRTPLQMALIGMIMMLAACAMPLEQPHVRPHAEPQIESQLLLPGDGHRLPLRRWLPEGAPRAVLIALHGFNDYSNAFAGPGEYLRQQGMALYAYDQRGFGASQSHGIWAGRSNLIGDLKQMVRALKQMHPKVPIYLLGESMGGAVVTAALAEADFPNVSGVILSAPAVWGDETMNGFYRGTLWLLAHTAPQKTVTGKGLGVQASSNIPMLQALGRDPLVIKETRIDAIYGIVRLMDEAYTKIDDIKVPVLMLYGAKDQVIPKEPIRQVLGKVKAPFTVAYYPDGYHMLLRDLKAKLVLQDIISWIDNRYKALPSGYDRKWKTELGMSTEAKDLTTATLQH